jgi:[NiFe] hydrogenase diaphorase moiety large subunit
MSELAMAVRQICASFGNDRSRLMDIAQVVQSRFGCISDDAVNLIAEALGIPRVEVQSTVSFYSFFSAQPKGRVVIRLCNDIVDEMFGMLPVAQAFERELGIRMGETTPDGAISLEWTACIGMSDQAPAGIINDVVVTYLSSDKAREIVAELRRSGDPRRLVHRLGDGHNAHPLVRSMVHNNIRRKGPVILADLPPGAALRKALAMSPVEVIRDIKTARLRGRGGAGFPTGMKWDFARQAEGERKFVICNADEGEPGTFKDRVILTEYADLLFEGMAIAGYAIGAREGILYLRGEYAYLRPLLEHILQVRRDAGLLGRDICGKKGFEFDIRIQLGAGAYVCGEETSLISSCEGQRGDPRNRPPFPAQQGYLGYPTVVNNVETFCCVARILDRGPGWFAEIGSKGSPGTKLFSVSGDCAAPGVYEFPFGITLAELLKEVGAEEVQAVQVGGPSGQLVGPESLERRLEYDDLATGGSIIIFDHSRDMVHVVRKYLEFFADESCGYCTPCRVGNVLLLRKIEEIEEGRGSPEDLKYLRELSETVKFTSRCGLGQTSPNPVLSLLDRFRPALDARLRPSSNEFWPTFDIRAALADAEQLTGRTSAIFAP